MRVGVGIRTDSVEDVERCEVGFGGGRERITDVPIGRDVQDGRSGVVVL